MKADTLDYAGLLPLLDELLDTPETDRVAWLARLPDTYSEWRPHLARMVEASVHCATLARVPNLVSAAISDAAGLVRVEDLTPGERIGPYELIRELGRGGMGRVWLANRADGAFTRAVALKLPLVNWAGHLGERMQRERDILAALEHPNIARFYDAGTDVQGRPFMAMEYVEGRPIDVYCRENRLSMRARLLLVLKVAKTVAFAHSKLVVHQDLKPSNILVTVDGDVRLLDFGIAKLIGSESAERGLGQLLTPRYASPEQMRGDAIGTATDVYSLGVVAYELLTEARAHQNDRPRTGGLLRAASESANDPSLKRRLRGDLDAILKMAMQDRPGQRYAALATFAADLECYLDGFPVHAREATFAYRARKFIVRNRVPVAAGSLVIAAILAGAALALWQAQHAAREARRADATSDFLVSVFRASDPKIASDKPRGQITAKELLDASAEHIGREFADDPETELQLLRVASGIYSGLGEAARAAALRKQRVDIALKLHGEASAEVIEASLEEVLETVYAEKYADADRMLERSDRLLRQAHLDQSALRARWWNLKGSALWDRSDARQTRVAAFSNSIALFAATAPQDPDYPTALNNRAVEAASAGQWNDAAAFYERALAVYDSSKERDDSNIGGVKIMYGIALQQIGKFDAAERAYGEAASLGLRTTGDRDGVYWLAVANHAFMLHALGARVRADQMFEALLPHVPDDYSLSSDNAYVYEYYGTCLAAEGRPQEGVVFLERAEKIFRERPMDEYDLPRVQRRLGDAYDRAGRAEDARRTLKAAYDKRVASSAPSLDNLLDARERWGRFLLAHGNPTEAAMEFNTVLREAHGRSLAPIALAHGGLALLAFQAGNAALAVRESDLAVGVLDNVKGLYDVRSYPYLWLIRARALLSNGNVGAARPESQRALDRSRQLDAPESSAIQEALGLVTATAASVTSAVHGPTATRGACTTRLRAAANVPVAPGPSTCTVQVPAAPGL